MAVGKRSADQVMEEDETPAMGREEAMQAASSQLVLLAQKAHAEALQAIRTSPDLERFCASLPKQGDLVDAAGTQPILLVLFALKILLGDSTWNRAGDSASLVSALEAWTPATMEAEQRAAAELFLEKHREDEYFQSGDHLGGKLENDFFEWVDAAMTMTQLEHGEREEEKRESNVHNRRQAEPQVTSSAALSWLAAPPDRSDDKPAHP
eukprot:762812-Hanusia_phi.AAC.8